MLKLKKKKFRKMDADTWLHDNFQYVIDNFAGGFVVIVDDAGLVFSHKDSADPRELVLKAKKLYGGKPLFFRVPHASELASLCVTIVR